MDPNAALAELRTLVQKARTLYGDDELVDVSDLIGDLVEGLDQWLSKGGFLPTDWERK